MASPGRAPSAVRLARLGRRLGLAGVPPLTARWVGATSTVYRWGDDLTIKASHPDAAARAACARHAAVCPVVRGLGVLAPRVLLVDDAEGDDGGDDALLVVSAFVRGRGLRPGETTASVWEAVGAQLALLHATAALHVPVALRRVAPADVPDPAGAIEALVARGAIGRRAGALLAAVRDRCASEAPASSPVLCHGDMHAGNVIAAGAVLTGLVDFAGAGWLEPAWDFAGIPVDALPAALAGHGGDAAELRTRIAWCRLQLVLARWAGSEAVTDEHVASAIAPIQAIAPRPRLTG